LFGKLVFDVGVRGSVANLAAAALLGTLAFSGIGLLAGSRADRAETVSGLVSLFTLPMMIFSGVFFSSARFPPSVQPFVHALPLTALNDVLRAIINDGASLSSVARQLLVLAAWSVGGFGLALRLFRWT
jgi:ABC-type multidrug transport system permease subunit